MSAAVTPVEHVTCPDEEFWTCGDVVLHEESDQQLRAISIRGANRLYLSAVELGQLADILEARSEPRIAVAEGWLTESKGDS